MTPVSERFACGHPLTMFHRGRGCRSCAHLRTVIRWGMRYWFARLIRGLPASESQAWARGMTVTHWRRDQRCAMRAWRRGVIERLRAQGASAYEIRAAYHGRTLAKEIMSSRASTQRYRDRWQGDPSDLGSPAWQRREVTRSLRRAGLPSDEVQ